MAKDRIIRDDAKIIDALVELSEKVEGGFKLTKDFWVGAREVNKINDVGQKFSASLYGHYMPSRKFVKKFEARERRLGKPNHKFLSEAWNITAPLRSAVRHRTDASIDERRLMIEDLGKLIKTYS